MSAFDQFQDKIIETQSLSGVTYTTGADGQPFRIAYISPGSILNPFMEGPGLPVKYDIENAPGGQVKFYTNVAKIDPTEPTFVYAHGWTDNAIPNGTSIKTNDLWNAYTTVYGQGIDARANVIFVDWSTLAKSQGGETKEPTWEATVTKQVGEVVAQALELSGADISQTTLVGHSLGSFVVGAAANALSSFQKVSALVALDTAATNPLFPEYDIDARNGVQRTSNPFDTTPNNDKPYDFTLKIANDTFSYTVLDYGADLGSLASNEARAGTANHAYLIAYTPMDVPLLSIGPAVSNYHNGVVTAYADLILKSQGKNSEIFNPPSELSNIHFNANGSVNQNGNFDGILVAAQPWITDPKMFADVGVIGWADSLNKPNIYGTSANDVMFYDRFDQSQPQAANLYGGLGNDLIGANAKGTVSSPGIDEFSGGVGADIFYFGHIKNGIAVDPFLDPNKSGNLSYAVIKDFNAAENDKINFVWTASNMKHAYETIDKYGAGMAFYANSNDLVAFVSGMSNEAYASAIASGLINYGAARVNLDDLLMYG